MYIMYIYIYKTNETPPKKTNNTQTTHKQHTNKQTNKQI